MTALAWALGFAAVIGVLIVLGTLQGRRRSEAMRRVAEAAGLTFAAKADLAAARSLGDVPLFARGRAQQVANLMAGRLGTQPVLAFDYVYSTGSGDAETSHAHTIVVSRSARPLPDLQMMPENLVTRLVEAFGRQDIDFDESPEFSRRYTVQGPDEAAIRAALQQGATSYFSAHPGWVVEAQSGTVAVYRPMTMPTPEKMRAYIDDACSAVRNL